MAWWTDWMNTFTSCPNGCGNSKEYLAPEFPMEGVCINCKTPLEGVRIIKRETTNAN